MGRLALTVKQTGSPIRCHQRKRVVAILRSLGLGRIGDTAQVLDVSRVRRALERVKHLIEYSLQLDIAGFAQEIRDEYKETIVGPHSRLKNGQTLWDQFEAAVDNYLGGNRRTDRHISEKINEIAVATALLEDESISGFTIQYEPNILSDGRKIDFVIDRGVDNLYVEVKTVHPTTKDSRSAWEAFLRRKQHHPETLDYQASRESMGGMIYANEFKSRAHFLEHTLAFEERLSAARAIKPGPGILVFCGGGFEWRKLNLENFADFYLIGKPRADDPFGKMQEDHIREKKISLKRNVDHFAFLERPVDVARKTALHYPVRGPALGRQ